MRNYYGLLAKQNKFSILDCLKFCFTVKETKSRTGIHGPLDSDMAASESVGLKHQIVNPSQGSKVNFYQERSIAQALLCLEEVSKHHNCLCFRLILNSTFDYFFLAAFGFLESDSRTKDEIKTMKVNSDDHLGNEYLNILGWSEFT